MISSAFSILSILVCLTSGVLSASADFTLSEHVAPDGVVYANENIINHAFGAKRDYTVALFLTSETGKIDCQFCNVLGPNFKTMASSYEAQISITGEERKLYFVLADVDNTVGTFKTLGVTHVPNLVFYPPARSKSEVKLGLHGPHSFMSFTSNGDQVEYLANIFKSQGFPITIRKPFPVESFLKGLVTLAFAVSGGYFFRHQLIQVWQAKQIWLAFSIMCVVMFISGHMFNVTRGTPFVGFDGDTFALMEPSFNSQFAVETQILATLYALLAFATIGLIKFVPKLESVKAQTAGAIFGATIIFLVYSILLQTFSAKMGGFPLGLLPISIL